MSKSRKITLGTKEWADSNVNCYYGCSNNCRYCYAKKMAVRFNRKTEDNWKVMVPNNMIINKNYRKRRGRIMFPTSHDITEESLENCLIVLQKLLDAGNEVLITTKPKFICITKICNKFSKFKDLIQFRFTITSTNDQNLKFWEPGAPRFEERLKCVKYAFENEFKTSISIEPVLDIDPYILVNILLPYITESIWIGKMNYMKTKNLSKNEEKFHNLVRRINTRENLLKIIEQSKHYEGKIIKIKDSIFNFIQK